MLSRSAHDHPRNQAPYLDISTFIMAEAAL
jgi:hypothetical protein